MGEGSPGSPQFKVSLALRPCCSAVISLGSQEKRPEPAEKESLVTRAASHRAITEQRQSG